MKYGELKKMELFISHPNRYYTINGDEKSQYFVENLMSKIEDLDEYLVIGTGTGGDWIVIDMIKTQ